MGLDAASFPALWAIYDATGIRPEWLLPALAFESGLNPGATNGSYFGLNQVNGGQLSAQGIDPSDYLSWPASQQLTRVVGPWFASMQNHFGPLRSATRIEQGNFLPATLTTARSLSSVLTSAPSAFYEDNLVFDPARKGNITVRDVANAMAKSAGSPGVRNAIAAAYALRPGESETDPVYGEDFGGGTSEALAWGIGIVAVAGAISYALTRPRRTPARARRRSRWVTA